MTTVFATLNQPQKKFALQRSVYSFSASVRRIQEMSMSIATVKIGNAETVPVGGYGLQISTTATDDINKKYFLYYNLANDNLDYQNGEHILTGTKMKQESNGEVFYPFEDNIAVSSIKGVDINGTPVDITKLNVLFYPPDPKIVMYAEYGSGSETELQSATITLKMVDTNFYRTIYINKLGLVSVDQGQREEK
jgi:hypothetical protein